MGGKSTHLNDPYIKISPGLLKREDSAIGRASTVMTVALGRTLTLHLLDSNKLPK